VGDGTVSEPDFMFHQTFQPHDLLVIFMLVVLEAALSIDNALVLGLLARRVPPAMRSKALEYGLFGAFIFRFVATLFATKLLEWKIVKLIGGFYLLYVAIRHLFFSKPPSAPPIELANPGEPSAAIPWRKFWIIVGEIELTDVAFAVDSILAAIALVGEAPEGAPAGQIHPKLWVIVTGGMLGVILMRFTAIAFIRLLEKFPRFEMSAYLLVIVIGLKLIVDWWFNYKTVRYNFHQPSSPAFWIFWSLMLACFSIGFIPGRKKLGPERS
jgi:YkoY family integral membrane protein